MAGDVSEATDVDGADLLDELARELDQVGTTAQVVMVGGAWMLWSLLRWRMKRSFVYPKLRSSSSVRFHGVRRGAHAGCFAATDLIDLLSDQQAGSCCGLILILRAQRRTRNRLTPQHLVRRRGQQPVESRRTRQGLVNCPPKEIPGQHSPFESDSCFASGKGTWRCWRVVITEEHQDV
jgi:hypothetical protein